MVKLYTPDELLAHCATRLSACKIPKALALVDALPRNANGKVLKATLRAQGSGAG